MTLPCPAWCLVSWEQFPIFPLLGTARPPPTRMPWGSHQSTWAISLPAPVS